MLHIISTPIGNLGDISKRALDTMMACDYILCEDTRHSRLLLKHFQIEKTLKSFHKFSEFAKEDSIINELLEGKIIGLISDAGTPGISDPGERLVRRCRSEGLPVSGVPGPCAAIFALTLAGFESERFQFVGFLPKKSGGLSRDLAEYLSYSGTTICYESPYRIIKVLREIHLQSPDRQLCVGRELTKKFEEVKIGTALELIEYYEKHTLKGEIVLIISRSPDTKKKKEKSCRK